MTFAINVLGWIGVAALLSAYWLVSTQKATGNSRTYQGMNLLGATLVLVNSLYLRRVPIGWCERRLDRDRCLHAGEARSITDVRNRKEVHMKTTRMALVAAVIVASGLVLHVARAQQAGIKRIDLQRHDLSVPDARSSRRLSNSTQG